MSEHIKINAVAPRIQYVADGAQTDFPFPFPIFRAADVEAHIDDDLQAGGFTVSGAGSSEGGTVSFAVAPAADRRVTLRRRLEIRRVTDFQADGVIRAKTLNDELDYQTIALQQLDEELGRTLRRAPTSAATFALLLPEPAAGRSLKWTASGGLANTDTDPDQVVALVLDHAAIAQTARVQVEADRDIVVDAAATATAAAAAAVTAASSVGDPLAKDQNLADLPDKSAARTNLELGTAAGKNIGTAAGNLVELDQTGKFPGGVLPLQDITPAGAMMMFAGAAAPAGWLVCDGAAVSRTVYAALFAALGALYGAGDGSTTFNLPDLRGRAAIGAGQGASLSPRALGQNVGAETHTLTTAQIPSHNHVNNLKNAESGGDYTNPAVAQSYTFFDVGYGSVSSTGGGSAHNNMQPSLAINFIIKT